MERRPGETPVPDHRYALASWEAERQGLRPPLAGKAG